jgi:hypothetical protein
MTFAIIRTLILRDGKQRQAAPHNHENIKKFLEGTEKAR